MATVADLLTRLHRKAWELSVRGEDQPRALDRQLRGWIPTASAALRVAGELGDRSPVTGLLEEVARGGLAGRGDADESFVAMSATIGAIADVLAGERIEVGLAGSTARTRLQIGVQAALHAAARATLAVAQADAQPAVGIVSRLAAATEAAALLPPAARGSVLDHVASFFPGADTVRGAVEQWSTIARQVIGSQHTVTGFAMQRTAASIAMICLVAADVADGAERAQLLQTGPAKAASEELRAAAVAWREAAVWPAHIRLGGRAAELRQASADLDAALRGRPMVMMQPAEQMTAMWTALHLANHVGDQHRRMMSRLAASGVLWVAVSALPPRYLDLHPGVRRSGWALEPKRSMTSEPLAAASRSAVAALTAASSALDAVVLPDSTRNFGALALDQGRVTVQQAWETVTTRPVRQEERIIRANAPTLPGFAI